MHGWLTFGWGLLGGIVAWFATMVIGHPFYSLLNLRLETARILQLYEPATKDDRGMSATWLAEREAIYRSCAAQLLAFAASQSVVSWIVDGVLHWKLRRAAAQLWTLAPLGPGADERPRLRAAAADALKLKL
ncbi:MAG TPA: hypothetical protein VNZ48_08085 [Xanthobacteraceae bacterium]|jgi:hypothetical protein|nr:hypothetical protein [Xanthobacteraceae bacterium]